MSIAYFAKSSPKVAVYIDTGESVKFEPVSWEEGVYPPAEDRGISDHLIAQLRLCIARGVGGLREISRDEFLALLKKKETEPDGLERPFREEWQPNFKINRSPSSDQPAVGGAGRVEVSMHNEAGLPAPTVSPVAPTANPQTPPAVPRPKASKRVPEQK